MESLLEFRVYGSEGTWGQAGIDVDASFAPDPTKSHAPQPANTIEPWSFPMPELDLTRLTMTGFSVWLQAITTHQNCSLHC